MVRRNALSALLRLISLSELCRQVCTDAVTLFWLELWLTTVMCAPADLNIVDTELDVEASTV